MWSLKLGRRSEWGLPGSSEDHLAPIWTSWSGTHRGPERTTAVLGGVLPPRACPAWVSRRLSVFLQLGLSVARDCWTCGDPHERSCEAAVSLLLSCECRTEDSSSFDAYKCLVKKFPHLKKKPNKLFLYTKSKGKCTLKSQEWMYSVWCKRVVCIYLKCKNIIKVEKNQNWNCPIFKMDSILGVRGWGEVFSNHVFPHIEYRFAKGVAHDQWLSCKAQRRGGACFLSCHSHKVWL